MYESFSFKNKFEFFAMRSLLLFLIACCVPASGQESRTESAIGNVQATSIVNGDDTYSSFDNRGCSDGFWFLTTHHSPQSFDRTCPQFRPNVSRYEECSSFRPSSLSELTTQLTPGVPVCIVVHGSFVDLPNASHESVCTWRWLKNAGMGQPLQVIYFYWPSFKKISLTVQCDVNQLGRQAARNGYYLAELIQHIPRECPTCLIGHSHGTRLIASGMHLMAGGSIQGIGHRFAQTDGRRIRSVFLASAIDHDWLNPGQKYDRALCSIECLLNLTNERDGALRIYPLRLPLIAKRALGLRGLTSSDRYQLGPISHKVLDYSIANVIGREHLWPFYFRQPQLAVTMRNYVYFADQALAVSSVEAESTIRQ